MCVEECPGYLIRFFEQDTPPSWVRGAESGCIDCGHCVTVCPTDALELSSIPLARCIPVAKELLPDSKQIEYFLKSRRSIRAYKDKPVEREKLMKLMDIARYAPSSHNGQPVQWLVVEKREKVELLARLTIDWLRELIEENPELARSFQAKPLIKSWDSGIDRIARGAPHIIFAHGRKDIKPSGDCTIALAYLELAAYSMGLGACWAGFVQRATNYSRMVAQVLQLPEGHASFGAMMIGYPKYRYTRIPPRNDAQVIWR